MGKAWKSTWILDSEKVVNLEEESTVARQAKSKWRPMATAEESAEATEEDSAEVLGAEVAVEEVQGVDSEAVADSEEAETHLLLEIASKNGTLH